MLFRYVAFLAVVALVPPGCNSISSTMLTRDESNLFWSRKGGLKGVPITLKVPTHVQLTVFERHFLVKDPRTHRAYRLPLSFVVRDFSQEFIYTEKIFTVDFKRPAAGTYNLNLDLTPDQYIQNLQHDVTDTTIQNVTALVNQLVPSRGGLAAVTASGVVEENIEEIQSVVAVGMFEVDAPDFEQQMSTFVNCHLNQAHDAWVAPPNVRALHRAQLSGSDQPADLCGGLLSQGSVPLDHRAVPPEPVVDAPGPPADDYRPSPAIVPHPLPRP